MVACIVTRDPAKVFEVAWLTIGVVLHILFFYYSWKRAKEQDRD
jgi:type IV secretory pathway TrbL component